MTFLYSIFGKVLHFFYSISGNNYGFAIVLFALFAKIITLPLAIKQTRSTQIMQMLQPATQIIQKKYAGNQQKQSEELQKLYNKYNYNPLSGCLPLLIQFPILIGLFGALRMPETYVFTEAEMATVSMKFLWIADMSKSSMEIFKEVGAGSSQFWLSLIIPLLSLGLSAYQNLKTNLQTSGTGQDASQKGMMIFMTVFIGYIGLIYSQGLALYWMLQSALAILQNYIMMKYFPLKMEAPKIVKRDLKK